MARTTYGTGTLYKRGRIWYLSYWVNGRQVQRSTRSTNFQDAKRLRDQILGKKARGEMRDWTTDGITCNELLDDLLEYARTNIKPSTAHIWNLVITANIRPFFGHLKVVALTTEKLKEYRRKRLAAGRSEATCNRELSMVRTALNRGRKCTPPKVLTIPYFPMVAETNVRQGFLTDEQYDKLRDALPDYLKPLFVTGYFTGVRIGELLSIQWTQIDWEQGFTTLNAEDTKSGYTRAIPIVDGDMRTWLMWSRDQADGSPRVFHNNGEPIKDFRGAWTSACKSAAVPDLKFHDLRRTAVRNMRRAGVPQVVRMRITGHRTDSMERRWDKERANPAFNDRKLARVQFGAALTAAYDAGLTDTQASLIRAAESLLPLQAVDGSWKIEGDDAVGSPATWGTALATHFAVDTLKKTKVAPFRPALTKAQEWFRNLQPRNTPEAAAIVLSTTQDVEAGRKALTWIRQAQSSDGGWGPRPKARSEAFDTAIVLLALRASRDAQGEAAKRGRTFLLSLSSRNPAAGRRLRGLRDRKATPSTSPPLPGQRLLYWLPSRSGSETVRRSTRLDTRSKVSTSNG